MTTYVKVEAPTDETVLMLWERYQGLRLHLSRIEDGMLTLPYEKAKNLYNEAHRLYSDKGIKMSLIQREQVGLLYQRLDMELRKIRAVVAEAKAKERADRRAAGMRDVTVWVPSSAVKRLREFAKELRAEALV